MEEHDTDIHELSGTSPEFRTQLAKQLEELIPEAIADGKVDVEALISKSVPLSAGHEWITRVYNREPGLNKIVLLPEVEEVVA